MVFTTRLRALSVAVVFVVLSPFSSMAATSEGHVSADTLSSRAIGGIFRISILESEIDSAFDGESAFIGTDIAAPVPSFEKSRGVALVLGGKYLNFGFEFGYLRVKHSGTWLGDPYEGAQYAVTFDFKLYPIRDFVVLPYVLVGAGFYWLRVKDGVIRTDEIKDATYRDFGQRVGVGVAVYPTRSFFICAELLYSRMSYTSLTPDGESDWLRLEGEINGSLTTISLGLGVTFGGPS